MIARRLAAVAIAAVLIVGAVLARRELDDREADAGPDAPPSATELVCLSELADACRALAASHPELSVTIEDAGRTLARLAAADDPAAVPLWLTIDPFPAMVDELRRGAGRAEIDTEPTPVGASQLTVAVPTGDRDDVLDAACAATALWRCLGDAAGSAWTDLAGKAAWGVVRPSFGDVDGSAVALASFAHAVGGYFGDPQISRARWEADPGFVPWLRRLANAVDPTKLSGGSPLATMATRPALDVAATTGAELTALGATSDRFEVRYPEPTMWVQAVLATPTGRSAPDGLRDDAAEALAGVGWQDLPIDVAGPPSAGVMLALRSLWSEAT